ncbi:hypothetical protein HY640_03400 [Candidatus Woesearchaeota archaeon]|nr:hypothetical protein [Candidatus Woesearchaeota archaeon]
MAASTIKLKDETKRMLDLIKRFERQSYDEVITELIEDKIEAHLELKNELKTEIIKLSEDLRNKRVKGLSFRQLYEKTYG